MKPPTLQQVIDAGNVLGIIEEHAKIWYDHYAAQGFVFSSNVPMVDIRLAMQRHKNNGTLAALVEKVEQSKAPKKKKLYPIKNKFCHCGLPAVHRNSSGSYDSFTCADHMPEKVKEKYQ
jgi:hypothetical protein